MKFTTFLAKIFYWNSIIDNSIRLVSINFLKRNLYNQKYLFVYFYKEDDELNYLIPNTKTIYYYDFNRIKEWFNKKQHIILLNNKHEIIDIYRDLNKDFKVLVLNWKKHKNINDIFKLILNKK